MQERVDIRDVARTAGVSITTVSNAISGKGRLSPETRERVRRIAEQMGYEPSVHARGLVTGETRLLAIQASGFDDKSLIPQVAYIQELINSAAQTSLELGYSLVVVPPTPLRSSTTSGMRAPASPPC
jgi:DNA-binding LacI/PurR family transcriptional regulator